MDNSKRVGLQKRLSPIKKEKALSAFRSGLNCSQAVLTAYSAELKLDNGLALNISSGFGGGMGRLQETCGAVTGSYMVLGLINGEKYTDNTEKKSVTYSMVQKFSERFKALNGTTDCRALLKCDLNTEEGKKFAAENNLFGTICEKCVSDSVQIIGELLKKKITGRS